MNLSVKKIKVGARASLLSRVQVDEVLAELKKHNPAAAFESTWVETAGDEDLKTSLKDLDKTDFFTKQIDELLLKGEIRAAIHSAKDLPSPLAERFVVAALTKGIDPSDVIVLPKNRDSLQVGARIGTSSLRREKNVQAFRPDLTCVDIRGNIQKRLEMLDANLYDGVVMAEAALIRLGLTDRKRIPLPGPTAVNQGRLAVVVRKEDQEMIDFFRPIHLETTLYLGTDPTFFLLQKGGSCRTIHFPVIEIVPKHVEEFELKKAYDDLNLYTHLVFTSKNAVKVFFDHLKEISFPIQDLKNKTVIAVGSVTAEHLRPFGFSSLHVAQFEHQEGVIELLNTLDLEDAYLFFPRSALSRPAIIHYFQKKEIRYQASDLYDIKINKEEPLPDLDLIDEILFTSPSTVKGFLEVFGHLPKNKRLTAIGPITQKALQPL